MKLIMTLPLVALQVAADTFSGDFLSFKLYNRCGTSPDRKKAFEDNFPTHGCWCPSLSTDTIAHKGRPLTDLDRLCLERSKCLRCNKGCPDDGYDADLDTDCSNASCAASNTDCQKAACECDLKFVQQVEAYFAANGEQLDATKDSVSADKCIRSSSSVAGARPSTNCPADSRTCGVLPNTVITSDDWISGTPLTDSGLGLAYDGVGTKESNEAQSSSGSNNIVVFNVAADTHFNVIGIQKTKEKNWGAVEINYSMYSVFANTMDAGQPLEVQCVSENDANGGFTTDVAETHYENNTVMKWFCNTAGKTTTGVTIYAQPTYFAIGELILEEDCE